MAKFKLSRKRKKQYKKDEIQRYGLFYECHYTKACWE